MQIIPKGASKNPSHQRMPVSKNPSHRRTPVSRLLILPDSGFASSRDAACLLTPFAPECGIPQSLLMIANKISDAQSNLLPKVAASSAWISVDIPRR